MPPVEREPLRLLVLADLHASREQAAPQELTDAADFQRLLETLAPMLRIEVENCLGASPAALEVSLRPTALRDLTPSGLLERVPALAPARQLVQLLGKQGAVSTAELSAALSAPGLERLRQALEAPAASPPPAAAPAAPPAAPATGAGVEGILSMVDVPSAEDRAASTIGKVVGAIGRARSAPAGERKTALQVVLATVGRQLDAILHHPEVKSLESAWRGLRLLVSRTDFRRGLRISVLHAPRAALLDEGLTDRIRAGLEGAGPDLILCAADLRDPAGDAAVAERLSDVAADLRAPLCLSVGLPFFGPIGERGELRLTHTSLEPAEYTRWRALREKDEARWLGAVCNRFLLRPPHAPEGGESAGLAYTEQVHGEQDYLWGDPVWLVGVLAFRSFLKVGWPTEILGSPGGRLDDLPVRPLARPGRGARRLPLEQLVSMDEVQQLARAGFMTLYSADDTDTALLLAAPPLFHQPAPGPRRGPSIGFPFQVVAGRVVRLIETWRTQLLGGTETEQARGLQAKLGELVAGSGPGQSVNVTAAEGDMAVDVKLGAAVLGGVSLELRFAL